MNFVNQIQINHARRRKKESVYFDGAAKQKIRHYIEEIRLMVEQSLVPQNKRDAIFKKLSELTLEIDRERTRFEVVADAIRGVARLSGDVEREGAEPWWKWVKLIFGEIDEAKDSRAPEHSSRASKNEDLARAKPKFLRPLPPKGERQRAAVFASLCTVDEERDGARCCFPIGGGRSNFLGLALAKS